MSLSNPLHRKAPLIRFQIICDLPSNRKYALKFLHRLVVNSRTGLKFTTKYLKKAYYVSESKQRDTEVSQMNPHIMKTTRRFSKLHLNRRTLATLTSPILYQLKSISSLPLNFKLGMFNKLLLQLKNKPNQRDQYLAYLKGFRRKRKRVVRNIFRLKFLQDLSIFVNENNLYNSIDLLKELQKSKSKISSLRSLWLTYKDPHWYELSSFSSRLASEKHTFQSITHFSLQTTIFFKSNIQLKNLANLTYLSLNLDFRWGDSLVSLLSLETLSKLQTFIFESNTISERSVIHFLKSLHFPKSLRNISLTLTLNLLFWEIKPKIWGKNEIRHSEASPDPQKQSFLSKLLHYFSLQKSKPQTLEPQDFIKSAAEWNPFEESDDYKEFYEQWDELDKLSNLTLSVNSHSEYCNLGFFFMIPILKRCKNLKSLQLASDCHCFIQSHLIKSSQCLLWEDLANALRSTQDTVESLNLQLFNLSYEKEEPPELELRNLQNLSVQIRIMKPKCFNHFVHIGRKEIQLVYNNVEVESKQELKEVFDSIKFIPQNVNLKIYLRFWQMSSWNIERGLLNWISSAQIEGSLHLELPIYCPIDARKLRRKLLKMKNLNLKGSLSIYKGNFELIFQVKSLKNF